MDALMNLLKALAILGVASACFVVWDHFRYPKFLSFPERLKADIVWENAGLDGIRCVKLKTTKERYSAAVEELGLSPEIDYPAFYKKFSANCIKVEWWDVHFPQDAQHFWLPDEGMGTRIHTAYINSYLYYAYEIN
jgi:hypothetical protein